MYRGMRLSFGLSLLLLSPLAQGAVIAKVDQAKKLVVLKVKRSEIKLLPGVKEISFTVPSANTSYKGHVKRWKGTNLIVQIKEGAIDTLTKGNKVTLSVAVEEGGEEEESGTAATVPTNGETTPATEEGAVATEESAVATEEGAATTVKGKKGAKGAKYPADKPLPYPVVPFQSPLFDPAGHAYRTKHLDVDAALNVITHSTSDESDTRGIYNDDTGVGLDTGATYHLKGSGLIFGSSLAIQQLSRKISLEQAKNKTDETEKLTGIAFNAFVFDLITPSLGPFLEVGYSQLKTKNNNFSVVPIRVGMTYLMPNLASTLSIRPKASKEIENAKYVLATQISTKFAYLLKPGMTLGLGLDYTMHGEESEHNASSFTGLLGASIEAGQILRFNGFGRYETPYAKNSSAGTTGNLGSFGFIVGAEYLMKQQVMGLKVNFFQGSGGGSDERGGGSDLFAQDLTYTVTYTKNM